MTLALAYPEPDRRLEAGDSDQRRVQRANSAAGAVLGDQRRAERDAIQQLLRRLNTLKAGLQQRLLVGGLTDFRRGTVQTLLRDTEQLIADATADLAQLAERSYTNAQDKGIDYATKPIQAAQLTVVAGTPGLDRTLVTAAFDNTVDLLTAPMQQFTTDVKTAIRRVALAGDSQMEELQRLRDKIAGQGFDNAAFRAERIIRTEIGRVFNEAAYTRMVSLAQQFPFLRKGWRAAKDARTRLGHQQAAITYQRGQGILIAERFQIPVYDERGKTPKLIGTALLRFPLDPQASPAGRIAAGATIMCRCNGIVDFAMAEFAAYTKSKVQTALTGVQVPAAPTKPTPLPKAPKPAAAKPAVKAPKVKAPKRTDVQPKKAKPAAMGPTGPAVSQSVDTTGRTHPGGSLMRLDPATVKKLEAALADIDRVHGDGNLPSVPAGIVESSLRAKGVQAYYASAQSGRPLRFGYGSKAMAHQPHMAVYHETAHFLDHAGFDGDLTTMTSGSSDLFAEWRKAVRASAAIQNMQNWRNGIGAPLGVNTSHLDYHLSTDEIWARSYAQYIAVKSGNKAALKELRNMQLAATQAMGKVPGSMRFNRNPAGMAPEPNTWDYGWAWSDADFQPILAAIDTIMERMRWRSVK
jgi:hypothetical protein